MTLGGQRHNRQRPACTSRTGRPPYTRPATPARHSPNLSAPTLHCCTPSSTKSSPPTSHPETVSGPGARPVARGHGSPTAHSRQVRPAPPQPSRASPDVIAGRASGSPAAGSAVRPPAGRPVDKEVMRRLTSSARLECGGPVLVATDHPPRAAACAQHPAPAPSRRVPRGPPGSPAPSSHTNDHNRTDAAVAQLTCHPAVNRSHTSEERGSAWLPPSQAEPRFVPELLAAYRQTAVAMASGYR
jgi:hypothetical protein